MIDSSSDDKFNVGGVLVYWKHFRYDSITLRMDPLGPIPTSFGNQYDDGEELLLVLLLLVSWLYVRSTNCSKPNVRSLLCATIKSETGRTSTPLCNANDCCLGTSVVVAAMAFDESILLRSSFCS